MPRQLGGRAGAPRWRVLATAAGGAAALLVPWTVRSVVLTGYLAYPSACTAVNVPWRVPRSLVLNDANWIRSWARQPEALWPDVLGRWDWLRVWVWRLPADVFRALEIAVAGLVVAVAAGGRAVGPRCRGASSGWVLVPAAASLAAWFASAPNPRFAEGSLWFLAAAAVALAVERLRPDGEETRPGSYRLAVCALWVAVFLFVSPLRQPLVVPPQSKGRFAPLPRSATEVRTTGSGLRVVVPVDDDRCWDAPLPCTPYFHPQLRLRNGHDLRGGFALDASVAYVDNLTITLPPGVEAPEDLGVRLLKGWYTYDQTTGSWWMRDPAEILLYTPAARTVRLALTMETITSGETLGDQGELSVTLNGRRLDTVSVHAGATVRMDLPLKRDFNVVGLRLPAGNVVPEDPPEGAPAAEPVGAQVLSIVLGGADGGSPGPS